MLKVTQCIYLSDQTLAYDVIKQSHVYSCSSKINHIICSSACISMYVRTYVCMYMYVCICMYMCMHACMYVCMYVCMHACMYVYMYMYIHMYACMYVRICMYVCMHACMYVYMYVCIYVTGPEKTGLIYTKYTYSYYGAYFSRVSKFCKFYWILCIYQEICV